TLVGAGVAAALGLWLLLLALTPGRRRLLQMKRLSIARPALEAVFSRARPASRPPLHWAVW
ncbi:hypothetical protein ACFWCM_26800, partial [Streptomyces albidoflavus]